MARLLLCCTVFVGFTVFSPAPLLSQETNYGEMSEEEKKARQRWEKRFPGVPYGKVNIDRDGRPLPGVGRLPGDAELPNIPPPPIAPPNPAEDRELLKQLSKPKPAAEAEAPSSGEQPQQPKPNEQPEGVPEALTIDPTELLTTESGIPPLDETPAQPQPTPIEHRSNCSFELKPDGETELTGQWEIFLPNSKMRNEYHAIMSAGGWKKVSLPSTWQESPLTRKHTGHAWYRCEINSTRNITNSLAIDTGPIRYVSELFFNGVSLGKSGSFDPLRIDTARRLPFSIPTNLWRAGPNLIAIHVYGVNGRSGIVTTPTIGNEYYFRQQTYLRDYPGLIIAILYFLASLAMLFFLSGSGDKLVTIYFSLFAATTGIYTLLQSNLRYSLFDHYDSSVKFELLLWVAAPLLFFNYLKSILELKRARLFIIFQILFGVLLIATLFGGEPSEWEMIRNANRLLVLLTTAFIAHTLYRNRPLLNQVRFMLPGAALFIIAAIVDQITGLLMLSLPTLSHLVLLVLTLSIVGQNYRTLWREATAQVRGSGALRSEEQKSQTLFNNIAGEFEVIVHEVRKSIGRGQATSKKSGSDLLSPLTRLQNFWNDHSLLGLLENDEYLLRHSTFNLARLCSEAIERALQVTRQNRRRLIIETPPGDIECISDPDLISATLYHLVENALLYTRGRIDITISAEASGQLLLTIRDEGPGLTDEQQREIFHKFTRFHDESAKIAGIGTGLTIVKLATTALGGEIKLEGGGFFSTFSVTIPIHIHQEAIS